MHNDINIKFQHCIVSTNTSKLVCDIKTLELLHNINIYVRFFRMISYVVILLNLAVLSLAPPVADQVSPTDAR